MPRHGETAAGQAIDARNAARELENTAASVAMEMVVMILPGAFVHGAGAGELDGGKPSVFQQGFNVAINRGDAQARYFGFCRLQNLVRGKRPVRPFERFANGGPLTGVPLISFQHLRPNDSALLIPDY